MIGFLCLRAKTSMKWEKCEAAVKFLKLSYPELTPETLEVLKSSNDVVIVLETSHVNGVGEQRAFFHRLLRDECRIPVIICREYAEDEPEDIQIKAGADLGTLLLDGFGDGIMLSNKGKIDVSDTDAYAFGILQAARVRMSKRNLSHVRVVDAPCSICRKRWRW